MLCRRRCQDRSLRGVRQPHRRKRSRSQSSRPSHLLWTPPLCPRLLLCLRSRRTTDCIRRRGHPCNNRPRHPSLCVISLLFCDAHLLLYVVGQQAPNIRVYVANPMFVDQGIIGSYTMYDVITKVQLLRREQPICLYAKQVHNIRRTLTHRFSVTTLW